MAFGSFSTSWWDIIIPIGIDFINDILNNEARKARKQWEYKREEVIRKVDEYNGGIQDYLSKKNQDYNFHKLILLHHSSFLAADEAYKLLHDARISIDAIGKMLIAAKDKRTFIENKLCETKSQVEKEVLCKELYMIRDFRKKSFVEIDKIKAQSKDLLVKVKHLNNQTRDLKIMIRDECGVLGEKWYQNLTMRNSKNRSESPNAG
jgi:hypothetical protein